MFPTFESPMIRIFFFGRSSQSLLFVFVFWCLCGFSKVSSLSLRVSILPCRWVNPMSGVGLGVFWFPSGVWLALVRRILRGWGVIPGFCGSVEFWEGSSDIRSGSSCVLVALLVRVVRWGGVLRTGAVSSGKLS